MIPLKELPVCKEFHALETAWNKTNNFALKAPTGSGKSIGLPWIIKDKELCSGQILVVQPRRIAAISLARVLSQALGSGIGEEVGYHIRFENKSSKYSRIIYVTDGILLGLLASDSSLSRVGLVIFDEFHERSLNNDASLALVKKIQQNQRQDLKILITSATIELDKISNFLPNCKRLIISGRTYPVEIIHKTRDIKLSLWKQLETEAKRAMTNWPGDLLIFTDGASNISKIVREIQKQKWSKGILVYRFFGDMPLSEQEMVFEPKKSRKIVVATNIAETSLTIPGIRIVIDSGIAKIFNFDSNRGINTLLSEKICRSSADQRSGRAGRTSPGVCIRLWSESEHRERPEFREAEIHRLDLTELFLRLLSKGLNPEKLAWYESPSNASWDKARKQLQVLGLVDQQDVVSETGRLISKIPIHPKLGVALHQAAKEDCLSELALILSISEGRNPVNREYVGSYDKDLKSWKSDFDIMMAAYYDAKKSNFCTDFCKKVGIHAGRMREVEKVAFQLCSYFKKEFNPSVMPHEKISKILIRLDSNQIVRLKSAARKLYENTSGKHLYLSPVSCVGNSDWALSLSKTEIMFKDKIQLQMDMVTEIREEWIIETLANKLTAERRSFFDQSTRKIVVENYLKLGMHKLDLKYGYEPCNEEITSAYANEILTGVLVLKNWNDEVHQLLERLKFIENMLPDYNIQSLDEEDKTLIIEQICSGKNSWKEIKNAEVMPVISDYLGQEKINLIKKVVPSSIIFGKNNRKIKLLYSKNEVSLKIKLQEIYDIEVHPTVGFGTCAIVVEILAPNNRVTQRTRDILGFWNESYPMIKKELAGRYPKHEWR